MNWHVGCFVMTWMCKVTNKIHVPTLETLHVMSTCRLFYFNLWFEIRDLICWFSFFFKIFWDSTKIFYLKINTIKFFQKHTLSYPLRTAADGAANHLNSASHLPHSAEPFIVLVCTSCELAIGYLDATTILHRWPEKRVLGTKIVDNSSCQ